MAGAFPLYMFFFVSLMIVSTPALHHFKLPPQCHMYCEGPPY